MPLTKEQIQLVQGTVPLLQNHGNEIAVVFYNNVFEKAPFMNNVFNRAHQENGHQAHAVAAALYAYARHIDDSGVLDTGFEKICHVHASMYVKPEMYDIVGTLILGAMQEVLGPAFTPEVYAAWSAAYRQLADIFIGKEAEHYAKDRLDAWDDWRDCRIVQKTKESGVITSLYLRPVNGQALPDFKAGQFITVSVEVPRLGYIQSRQYSLSDAPNKDHYRVSVKREAGVDESHPGYVSNILHDDKQVGEIVRVSHPQGNFFLDTARHPDSSIVLLSAGVGITPMMSMLNQMASCGSKQCVTFANGTRSTRVRAFHDHLLQLEKCLPNLRYLSFVTNIELGGEGGRTNSLPGRLCLETLDGRGLLYKHDSKTQYFVCGPDTFMADIRKGLLEMGVDGDRVHEEVFGPAGWPA